MAVRVLLVLAAFVVLYGCGQANSPTERQEQREGVERAAPDDEPQQERADLPDHDVMVDEDCSAGFPRKCINVATDATSEEAFTLLTEHFRDENPDYRAVLVTFYGTKEASGSTGSGYWFADEEAARSILSRMRISTASALARASVDEEVRRTMDNGGLYVVSLQEAEEDMWEEACQEWDTEIAGSLPPECQ
jgi:hypothetical protein